MQIKHIALGLLLLTHTLLATAPLSNLKLVDAESAKCLAENIYFESRGEPLSGQIAVSFVVLNRVNNPRFPSSICSVIKQRTKRVCQFSWVCSNNKNINSNKLENAMMTSVQILAGAFNDPTKGALFYHASSVDPGWKLRRTTVIGNHIFYTYHD